MTGRLQVSRADDGSLVVGRKRPRVDARDEVPRRPRNPTSKPGEIYELGPHRLLCGDNRWREYIGRLFGDEWASVMWTDPPYGVGYTAGGTRAPIAGDARDGNVRALLTETLTAADPIMAPGAPFYIASAPGSLEFLLAIQAAGWRKDQSLVWVKDQFVLGHSDYHYRHEEILYGHVPSSGRVGRGRHEGSTWRGDNAQDTVFEFPRPRRNKEHSTIKPVGLIVAQLRNSLQAGEIVYDPYAGSGTTMVAAAALEGRAFMVELDAGNCDVIRARAERMLG